MGKSNNEMVALVLARQECKRQKERIAELTKMLSRAGRELELVTAQHDDKGSDGLIERIKQVLRSKQ